MLLLGDCLERIKEIPDGSLDLVLADPPYGTTQCKWDSIIPLDNMWKELNRVIKPRGAVVITAVQPFTTTLIDSNMKMFRYSWIWEKNRVTGHLNANRMPMRAHEDVLVFYEKLPCYHPQKTKGHKVKSPFIRRDNGLLYGSSGSNLSGGKSERFPESIIKGIETVPTSKTRHPTQKPIALMEYLIKTYTNPGYTVLDFCMGSGTTGVAAVNTGRKFIGIEKDEGYFEIAKKRIYEAEQQKEAQDMAMMLELP